MELITPGAGLIFWQAVVFLSLFLILRKFAWRPILDSLKIREESIEDALNSAEQAREEMQNLKSENEQLLNEARAERDQILKEATVIANKIKEDAKEETSKTTDKMIEDAKAAINTEKESALSEVKNLVGSLSVSIAEKILRKKLGTDKEQQALIVDFMKDLNLN